MSQCLQAEGEDMIEQFLMIRTTVPGNQPAGPNESPPAHLELYSTQLPPLQGFAYYPEIIINIMGTFLES